MFKEYDDYLSGVEDFDNCWSDIGISRAVQMLEMFTDEDWTALYNAISEKTQIWLISCTETLSEVTTVKQAHRILSELTKSEDPDVSNAANSSLRDASKTLIDSSPGCNSTGSQQHRVIH
jgi:hypothetical protein